MANTTHLQGRIVDEFLKRLKDSSQLDAALKDRITTLAASGLDRVKPDQIRLAILGEDQAK